MRERNSAGNDASLLLVLKGDADSAVDGDSCFDAIGCKEPASSMGFHSLRRRAFAASWLQSGNLSPNEDGHSKVSYRALVLWRRRRNVTKSANSASGKLPVNALVVGAARKASDGQCGAISLVGWYRAIGNISFKELRSAEVRQAEAEAVASATAFVLAA